MLNDQELISIIMPMFNAEKTIEKAVQSVQQQSFKFWELIIVDDNSTDNSLKLVSCLAQKDSRIKILRLSENKGAAVARNYALEYTTGRYIAFLDADDFWYPGKLERQLDYMKLKKSVFCFTSYVRVDKNGNQLKEELAPNCITYHDLLRRNVIGCLTVMYDTAVIGKQPMPLYKRPHDYALWLKLVKYFHHADGLDEILAVYLVDRGTLSTNKLAVAREVWSIFRQQERLGLLSSIWYFSHYTFYGLRYRLCER